MINLGGKSVSIRLVGCAAISIWAIGCGGIGAVTPTTGVTDGSADLLGGFAPEDIARVFISPQATASDVEGTALPAGEPTGNVMQDKLQDAVARLNDPATPEEVALQSVDQVMEALFMSNLVILPTAGAPEADPLVFEHQLLLQQAIAELERHVDTTGLVGTPASKQEAAEAQNFLMVMQEALEVVGQQTRFCDPENLRDPACVNLLADDEGGVDIDNVFPGFSRQVRSPFFIGAQSSVIQEQVIVPDSIALDECVVVLKEIQGVKAVVRKKLIPIWVEPWFARATIVGFRVVWVWEFIPAEYLKTISYCNVGGSVVQNVDTTIVLERELLHFWSFLNKDVTLSP